MALPYRKNVAAFILNNEGEILTCQRADKFNDWQLPQGGVDLGEETFETLTRELAEEVGLEKFQIIASLPEPILYEWPPELHHRGFRGQEQYFYAAKPDEVNWKPNLNLHHQIEFKSSKWLNLDDFIEAIGNSFRAESYKTAAIRFEEIIPKIFKRKT